MEEVRVTRRLFTQQPSDITKALSGIVHSPHAKALSYNRTNYVVRDCSTKAQRSCRVMLNIGLKIDPLKKR